MLKLKVNNIDVEVEEGLTVLQACEKAGVNPIFTRTQTRAKRNTHSNRATQAVVCPFIH